MFRHHRIGQKPMGETSMNVLWGGMILIGIIYGAFHGTMQEVTDAVLASSREAVSLCITMAGVMALWVGIMEIAKESGIVEALSGRLRPFLKFMFPKIPEGHPAQEHITVNFIANILGLGWAATPAGLKAMKALARLEEERRQEESQPGKPKGIASNEMCTFLILNISSLQLIPVNIIAYRAQYGSVNPGAVVVPGIVATSVSTGAAILFCKVMDRKAKGIRGG